MKYPLKKYDIHDNPDNPYDFNILENTRDKIFKELRINPKQHNIIISEPIMISKCAREKMAQIMFETFEVKGLYFLKEPILKWFANYYEGSGIIIDLGDYSINITPIFDGFSILPHACIKYDFEGKELDKFMIELLSLKCIDSIRKCDYDFEDKEHKKINFVLSVENRNFPYSNFYKQIEEAISKEFHSSACCKVFNEEEEYPNPNFLYYALEKYYYQDFTTLEE